MDLKLAMSGVVLGETITFSNTVTGYAAVTRDEPYGAAKTGTLTTRSSGTAGTLTMESGHGITTSAKIDIYWDGGVAYKATVGTVSGTSVPFTLANGDALPAAATAVTAMVPNTETFVVAYASMVGLLVGCGGVPMVARFLDGSDADICTVVVNPGTAQFVWGTGTNGSNPITSNAAKVCVTHGSSAGTKTPKVIAVTS